MIKLAEGARVAGVFTHNRFCAAPVLVAREHLPHRRPIRALVVNTGNANAGTGERGLAARAAPAPRSRALLGIAPEQVLPFSTGVIMEPLPVERIAAGLARVRAPTSRRTTGCAAASAIMTTDTRAQGGVARLELGGRRRSPSPASPRAPA